VISHERRGESAEEGAGRQDRDDCAGLRRGYIGMALAVLISGGELVPPEVHGQDAADGSCVVAKQDTAESYEGADGDGGP